jgi:flagellar biogenesis protein FliO
MGQRSNIPYGRVQVIPIDNLRLKVGVRPSTLHPLPPHTTRSRWLQHKNNHIKMFIWIQGIVSFPDDECPAYEMFPYGRVQVIPIENLRLKVGVRPR